MKFIWRFSEGSNMHVKKISLGIWEMDHVHIHNSFDLVYMCLYGIYCNGKALGQLMFPPFFLGSCCCIKTSIPAHA